MKTLRRLLALMALLTGMAFADGQYTFIATAPGSSNGIPLAQTGISYHKLTWTTSGTVSACTVALDSSADGVTYSAGGVITGQACTSPGASAIFNSNVNFVRVTFTALSGGGTVSATWNGYNNNPVSGSGTVGSCAGAGNAYYAGAGTTIACDTSVTDNGTGTIAATVFSGGTGSWIVPYATDANSSANTYKITVPGLPASITTGLCVHWKAGAASSGVATLEVIPSGGTTYTALPLDKRTTAGVAALSAAGDITSGGIYESCYDGSEWVVMTTSSTTYSAGALAAGSMVRGNSNNQVQSSGGISSTAGTVFTSYNSETAAGVGMAYERGVTSQKAETGAADAALLSVTPAATVGTYRTCVSASITTATSGVVGFTESWTDSSGNAQANIAVPLYQYGTAAPANTFTTSAAGDYGNCIVLDVNNAQAAILTKWVGGGTSAAKVSAITERMQ